MVKEEDEKERQLLRWALQAEARHWLPNERVAFCLRLVSPIALGVEVLHDPQHQRAHYGGLIQCGSVWHCPNCAAKISERRRSEDLESAISYHTAHNGAVYMETYTISHTRFDSLPDLLQAFLKARERMQQDRQVRKSKQAFGVVGTISVLEVTWSKLNAWHPHKHELVFTANCESDRAASIYEAQARVTWKKAAERFGLQMDEHGYQLDRTYGAVADYIAKYGREPIKQPWGVETEMTKGHLKQGRGRKEEHVTPFGLLYRIYLGEEEPAAVFQEYARCFKGKKQLSWSKGLRKRLLGNEQEKTDKELAQEQKEDAVLLGRLTRAQWRVVLANDARGELLEIARLGDWEFVKAFLADIGCDLTESEPMPVA